MALFHLANLAMLFVYFSSIAFDFGTNEMSICLDKMFKKVTEITEHCQVHYRPKQINNKFSYPESIHDSEFILVTQQNTVKGLVSETSNVPYM